MKLSLTCEHGTRTLEFEEGREGIGNVQSSRGERSYVAQLVAEATPRCPYCEQQHAPVIMASHAPRWSPEMGT